MMTERKVAAILAAATIGAGSAAAFAQGSGISPGQWQTTVTINSIDMPGAPAGVAKMMMGHKTTVSHCVTAADAAKGPQDMLKQSKSCAFSRYSMAGGRLNATMTCKQGGGTMTATTVGAFTPVSFSATSRIVSSGGGMPMTMTSTTAGRRVGDCK